MASHRPAFTAFDRRQRGLSSDSGSTSTSSPRSRTSSSYAADDDAAAAMDNPGVLVRALFDFASTDGSSLSFRAGDIINVYHQLETGWWDGVFDGCRGCVCASPSFGPSPDRALLALVPSSCR